MSDAIIDTEPNVSTVGNDFTRTWCAAILLAMIVRVTVKQDWYYNGVFLQVTQTGSPSGMKATITPMTLEIIPETVKNPL